MTPLTIGQVARRSGVAVETIRFYEKQRLIEKPPRSASGYRQYPEEVVGRIQFVQRAKELGFSLKEIEELLALRYDPVANAGEVRARAESKIADIAEKIRDLDKIRSTLVSLTRACVRGDGGTECAILSALSEADTERQREAKSKGMET